eukprot:CAMPEP_0113608320 /NCGR_PEP_ID=MMETSP0017_2-20120614/3861_1 /TAXON_ID=2856 /ORGANISM="Cylindrotheca closterium" /LENGTH=172 /DNA_ID=CAMNT_0000516995 /DNA_START=64 /DNA_END=582 /DNA_ORIENTATION=+ /assembly_acc=CAM_ASM_000147
MTSSTDSILDSFLQFFQCAGLEQFTADDYEENAVASAQEVLEPARPIGSSSTSSPTSIYSIPSRESMTEIRQDSMSRFGRSPLFGCTSSTPMKFSFEDSSPMPEYELDKRDDSIRTTSVRSEARQFYTIKRVNSIATVTTADSASVVEENLQVHSSAEDSPEYQVDVVAVRE